MPPVRVLVFGDSVAQGCWDSEGGWVDRLKREMNGAYVSSGGATKVQVINLGIGGESTNALLKRLRAEIEARVWHGWQLAFIFCTGTNDVRVIDGVVESTPEQFRQNNEAIMHIAQEYSDRILFVGQPPLAQPELNFKGKIYNDTQIAAYERVQQETVEAAGMAYVRTRPAFESRAGEVLHVADGVHPNDTGHRIIADLIRPWLADLINASEQSATDNR